MITLAVDTATKAVSVAVIENGNLRGETLIHHKTMHQRHLMPLVDQLVRATGIEKNNIDRFVTTIGPGSFTGIRIGVSTVKAMAYALKKPVVGINTLDCLAFDVPEDAGLVCPVIDARNNQVFCALYRRRKNKAMERLTEYMGIDIKELMALLVTYDEPVLFTGDASGMCSTLEKGRGGFSTSAVHPGRSMPRAAAAGFMAELEEAFDPALLMPFYLRKSGAERMAGL